jgi:hypothetical protein
MACLYFIQACGLGKAMPQSHDFDSRWAVSPHDGPIADGTPSWGFWFFWLTDE